MPLTVVNASCLEDLKINYFLENKQMVELIYRHVIPFHGSHW